jgi:hypothetical protein
MSLVSRDILVNLLVVTCQSMSYLYISKDLIEAKDPAANAIVMQYDITCPGTS